MPTHQPTKSGVHEATYLILLDSEYDQSGQEGESVDLPPGVGQNHVRDVQHVLLGEVTDLGGVPVMEDAIAAVGAVELAEELWESREG